VSWYLPDSLRSIAFLMYSQQSSVEATLLWLLEHPTNATIKIAKHDLIMASSLLYRYRSSPPLIKMQWSEGSPVRASVAIGKKHCCWLSLCTCAAPGPSQLSSVAAPIISQ